MIGYRDLPLPDEMPETPCFFCLIGEAEFSFGRGIRWPEPMQQGIGLAICRACAEGLSADEKAQIVADYVKDLRTAHNLAVERKN